MVYIIWFTSPSCSQSSLTELTSSSAQWRDNCRVEVMRVLVIGGYGAFGARIVKRLKRIPSLEVLTGGRNSARADVVMDVKKGESLVQLFQELRPHVVIHTAGPFDLSEDYAVAKACLMASNAGHKCNYLDLADNVDYVLGFGKLDEEAKKKGCVLVTGVSTTPAITTVSFIDKMFVTIL